MKNLCLKQGLIFISCLFISVSLFADTTYVKFGSTWKYLDAGTAAPIGAGAADWRNVAFNDASWSSGPAELGYGDNKERTTVSYGPNPNSKYITTYFRKIVNIANISLYSAIQLNAYIDDGAVIYVNGTEVARTNMPAGTPVFSTLASAAATENGNGITSFNITTSAFVSGNNMITVEVHQSAASSSDLAFDLELITKPTSTGTTLFNFLSSWKYLDNGSNQGVAWIPAAFSDGSWKTGNGKFGYGDAANTIVYSGCPPSNYPAAEVAAPACATKFITTYFRKTFNITGVANYASFTFNVYRDDGIAIYVNGTEVKRDLLAAGAGYTTLASSATDDGQVINAYTIAAASANFVEGSNTIAVEIHQTLASSTDISFDMQLIGNPIGAEPGITRGPILQVLSQTGVTLKWKTSAAATARIIYGTSENALTSTVSDNTSLTDHELRITGLSPDTRYYYAVGTATSIIAGSYRNTFNTAPPASSTRKIRIVAFGDAGKGTNSGTFQKVVRDAYIGYNKGGKPDLALFLGDNAYDNGTDAQHQTNCFDIYDDNVFKDHPVFAVPGNHEYDNDPAGVSGLRGTHAIPYYDNFILPTAAESGGTASGTEHYYSFDYGNIHFIMLDSYGYDGGKLLADSTGQQALWLKSDLAANAGSHKWTVVCLHHPPYTHGTHTSDSETDLGDVRRQITPILERFGVDVVLAGHSHVYERSFLVKDHTGSSTPFNTAAVGAGTKINGSSAKYDGSAGNAGTTDIIAATSSCPYFTIDSVYKHGTVYVVAGSAGQIGAGGGSTYPVFYLRNQSTSTGGESGSLYLEVQDNRLDAKFIGASGTVRDQFTIMKGVNKKNIISSVVNSPVNMTASWVGGYNWYTTPATVTATSRTFAVTPSSTGNYTYYVNDSLSPKTTCIADTFQLQVTSALAVSISKFNALLKNNKVYVQWTTQQEINSDYFTVERSSDGLNYEMAMVIGGKGDSETPTDYEFIDNHPLEGTSYYRLVATDKNGDAKIAGVRTVNYRINKTFSITISPNPAVNNEVNTTIQSTKKQALKVKVFNMNGAEVYSSTLQAQAGSNSLKFNLMTGTYVISIEAPDGKINEKVIVK